MSENVRPTFSFAKNLFILLSVLLSSSPVSLNLSLFSFFILLVCACARACVWFIQTRVHCWQKRKTLPLPSWYSIYFLLSFLRLSPLLWGNNFSSFILSFLFFFFFFNSPCWRTKIKEELFVYNNIKFLLTSIVLFFGLESFWKFTQRLKWPILICFFFPPIEIYLFI